MIRMVSPNEQLEIEDIQSKYVWESYTNMPARWTANEYPLFVNGLREEAYDWDEGEDAQLLLSLSKLHPNGGMKPYGMVTGINSVFCVCDNLNDVETVRELGQDIRNQYREFVTAYRARMKALDNQRRNPDGPIGSIRMLEIDTEITPQDVHRKYIWKSAKTFTAHTYPEYVYYTFIKNDVLYGSLLRERPTFVPETGGYILTGENYKTPSGEIRLSGYDLQCICETPLGVNHVRQVGSEIRENENRFWTSANEAMLALDNYEPQVTLGRRI